MKLFYTALALNIFSVLFNGSAFLAKKDPVFGFLTAMNIVALFLLYAGSRRMKNGQTRR